MTACVHGNVCREYLRQHKGIICQTCPSGCRFYEPQERTCRIYDTDHGFEDSIRCDACQMTFRRPWQPFKFCPNCGARVVPNE